MHVVLTSVALLRADLIRAHLPFWQDLVNGLEKPIIQHGYINVPDIPGLGFTLNNDECKIYLKPGTGYFEPSPMWDDVESNSDLLLS